MRMGWVMVTLDAERNLPGVGIPLVFPGVGIPDILNLPGVAVIMGDGHFART